jgi:FkbM family methyltransferase
MTWQDVRMYPLNREPQLSRQVARLITDPIGEVRKGEHDKDNALHFRAFASAIAQRCRSELLDEAWVLWRTNAKEHGYFVEFGAGDGLNRSNSYFLEWTYRWSGIVAEPHPDLADSLHRNRGCFVSTKCVYGRSGETLEFMLARDRRRSRIAALEAVDAAEAARLRDHKTASVESISLGDLLDEARAPSDIDYVSIDTGGAELEILSAFDFRRWNVRLLTIAHNFSAHRGAVEALLERSGYTRVWPEIDQADDWYVKNTDHFAA